MRPNKIFTIVCAIMMALSLAVIQAKADTWYLNTSNANLGVIGNYASVDIGVVGNTATFTIDVNNTLLGTGTNFGIQSFYFNTSLSTIGVGDFTSPTGWGAAVDYVPPTIQADGFGRFIVENSTTGAYRLDPLVFSITDSSITSALEFYVLNADGHHFAAHIAGFDSLNGNTSAFFTDGNGNTPVPEPSTMLLVGAGLLGLAIYGKRRMNS